MTDYEEFARAQLPQLSRYAVMLTGEHDLAADLVQDVLVKVYQQWSKIAATDRPDRYVLRMVTNQHLSWRRRWPVRNIVSMSDVPERAEPGDVATSYAARDDMWRRLAQLPNRQRAVVVLRYYEHLSDAEIADVLGCSAGTVRGYAHRALATLRADLTAELTASLMTSTEEI